MSAYINEVRYIPAKTDLKNNLKDLGDFEAEIKSFEKEVLKNS